MKKVVVIFTSIVVALVSSVLLTSCFTLAIPQPEPTSPSVPSPAQTPPSEPEPEAPLEETEETTPIEDITWVLESYGDRGSLKPIVEDREMTAEFKSADNTVVGSGGCNSYFADYGINGNNLNISSPIWDNTMACFPPIMDQEQEYSDLLETAETFLIHNDKLIISCSANKEMVFTEKATEEEPPEEAPPIEDISWELEAYGDKGSLNTLVEDTKITAEFKSADGQVVGSAGCNGYSVDYEIDGFEIIVTPPVSTTMMLCFPSPIMDQEQEYLELLETAETFLVHNKKLIISCADNKEMVFVFNEEIPSIEDISWELESYGDAGSLQSLVTDTNITAEFRKSEGRVVGTGGCNSYFVEYEIDGYELTIIPPLGSTMMLCFPAPIMEQEQDYFDLLKTAESFRVGVHNLIISCAGDKELSFTEP